MSDSIEIARVVSGNELLGDRLRWPRKQLHIARAIYPIARGELLKRQMTR